MERECATMTLTHWTNAATKTAIARLPTMSVWYLSDRARPCSQLPKSGRIKLRCGRFSVRSRPRRRRRARLTTRALRTTRYPNGRPSLP
ncbi:hypothetical protein EVAR_90802_1 [Eumeta japonica]|uniref:Uncharacterized protein n=1 Tax=Eumeta variegata TaxID=151549 RepID=A0A4C2A6H6_EUMVA|nr:hypothetical protein EVAR_90802_1 [Eumeta japonica]